MDGLPCTLSVERHTGKGTLLHTPEAVELDGIRELPVLDEKGNLVGHVEHLRLADKALTGVVRFDDSLAGDVARNAVSDRSIRGLALNYEGLAGPASMTGAEISKWRPINVRLAKTPDDPRLGFIVTEMQRREASFEPSTFNASDRTVSVVWSTGAKVRRTDWWTGESWDEVLSLDPGHVRMGRLTSGAAPLLATHDAGSLNNVLGVVSTAWLANGEGHATVRFSEREDVKPVLNDVRNGILKSVSVGYKVHRTEVDEGTNPPTQRVIDWEPHELSLVPIPADSTARVRSALNTTTAEGNDVMELQTERTRVASILELTKRHGLADMAPAMIENGVSLDEVRRQVLNHLADRDSTGTETRRTFSLSREDSESHRRTHMVEALYCRAAVKPVTGPAEEFRHMSVADMAGECLRARGINTGRLSRSEMITRALHSTSDFSNLLLGVGERSLRDAYVMYSRGLKTIARQKLARDFRPQQRLQLSEAPALLKVNEAGEFTYGTMSEAKESYSLATYGRIFGLSRQGLVNDDLGAFSRTLMEFGKAAAALENQRLVDVLTSNPTMHDSVALFHATHANLGMAGAISVTALGEARKKMRLQTGLDGTTVLDLEPVYLVVPAALETIANQYVTQITPAQSSNVNPFVGLSVVTDPRLDAASATAWYLACDPMQCDHLEYSFLEGFEGPYIEERVGFEVDGFEIKCRLDFACAVLDWRGLVKNAGS